MINEDRLSHTIVSIESAIISIENAINNLWKEIERAHLRIERLEKYGEPKWSQECTPMTNFETIANRIIAAEATNFAVAYSLRHDGQTFCREALKQAIIDALSDVFADAVKTTHELEVAKRPPEPATWPHND
jgi:hypothetical protein